jgi:hypothetical protein
MHGASPRFSRRQIFFCHCVQSGSGVHKALYPEDERPEREADHTPPSSAEVKECVELYFIPPRVFMAWCFTFITDQYEDRLRMARDFVLYSLFGAHKIHAY